MLDTQSSSTFMPDQNTIQELTDPLRVAILLGAEVFGVPGMKVYELTVHEIATGFGGSNVRHHLGAFDSRASAYDHFALWILDQWYEKWSNNTDFRLPWNTELFIEDREEYLEEEKKLVATKTVYEIVELYLQSHPPDTVEYFILPEIIKGSNGLASLRGLNH